MFITLTDLDLMHIRINVAQITSYVEDLESDNNTTLVSLTSCAVLEVRETSEAIDTILGENYVTVRRIRNAV